MRSWFSSRRASCQNALDRRMNPPLAALWPYALFIQARADTLERHSLCPHPPHSGDDLLLAGVFDQQAVPAEIPAEWRVSADPLAAFPLHAHRAARSFPNHGPF